MTTKVITEWYVVCDYPGCMARAPIGVGVGGARDKAHRQGWSLGPAYPQDLRTDFCPTHRAEHEDN